MKIKEKYKMVFMVGGVALTYTGTIIQEDDLFITFKDKFEKTLAYNKKNLISFEEVKE